jgi:hypothetical protein
MIGNGFGDVLFLLNTGAKTGPLFKPFVNADAKVPFVLSDPKGGGVVLANQRTARAAVRTHYRSPGMRSGVEVTCGPSRRPCRFLGHPGGVGASRGWR